jgi:hypothetical protein
LLVLLLVLLLELLLALWLAITIVLVSYTLMASIRVNKQCPSAHPYDLCPPIIITYLHRHVTKDHVTRSRDLRRSFISLKVSNQSGRLVETASQDVSRPAVLLQHYMVDTGQNV